MIRTYARGKGPTTAATFSNSVAREGGEDEREWAKAIWRGGKGGGGNRAAPEELGPKRRVEAQRHDEGIQSR